MPRRVLIWLLSAALVAAPLAPAWAMARKAPDLARNVASGHVGHFTAQPTDRIEGSAGAAAHDHSIHMADKRTHMPATSHDLQRAQVTHAGALPIAHVHDRANQLVAGHSSADCGDGRCDGQCCGVCILTLGGSMSYTATVTFGASDSPSYRAHTYTSFVPTLLGRPPQS